MIVRVGKINNANQKAALLIFFSKFGQEYLGFVNVGLTRAAARSPEKRARKDFIPEKPMAKRACTDRLLELKGNSIARESRVQAVLVKT